MTSLSWGEMLLCPRLTLPHHEEEAHYGRESWHQWDYKHM